MESQNLHQKLTRDLAKKSDMEAVLKSLVTIDKEINPLFLEICTVRKAPE